MRIQGPHQAALRRRSVNVFDGAMKVLRMRAASDIGGVVTGVGLVETGGTGEAAILASCKEVAGILAVVGPLDKPGADTVDINASTTKDTKDHEGFALSSSCMALSYMEPTGLMRAGHSVRIR